MTGSDWIDCGRYAHVPLEQTPPHWITLPHRPPTSAESGQPAGLDPAASVSTAAAIDAAAASGQPPAPRLRELPFDRFLRRINNRLRDPISARPSVRLTDRLSAGLSSRHTQLDDQPETQPAWPLIDIQSPDQIETLLQQHDAAWTAFDKSGNALALRFDLPADTLDVFYWIPVLERFFNRHATMPILLDGMGPTHIKGWDQLVKVGAEGQVYGLARGLPGLESDRRHLPPEALTPTELRRADAILHFYVGEVGAARVLFGSGHGRHAPLNETCIHAQAQWFAQHRAWLEPDSAEYLLTKNAQRLSTPKS